MKNEPATTVKLQTHLKLLLLPDTLTAVLIATYSAIGQQPV